MREREPSRTALAAATHRAVHQVLEDGRVFTDPLAVPIVGDDIDALARKAETQPTARSMRLFIAARSRVSETALAVGVEVRGVRQLVVLGAGQDTFAYRNPFEGRLRVFEVDHPATQAWKRRRLASAGITIPPSLTFVPVDFERDDLMEALATAGFASVARTFFAWLGVVPYLTADAVAATLASIGKLSGGGEVTFDYSDPPESLSPEARLWRQRRAERVAALGEPFLTSFEPAELHADLRKFGFDSIEDHGPASLIRRYIQPDLAADSLLPERGGHVILAATTSTTLGHG